MKSKYTSPKSVAKNQTIPIDVNDPRLKRLSQGKTIARSGAEILPIDFNQDPLIAVSNYRGGGDGGKGPDTGDGDTGTIDPGKLDPVKPGPVSNLVVTWSGKNLNFEFDFDPNTEQNKYATGFRVHATAGSTIEGYSSSELFLVNKSLTHHSYVFTEAINQRTFGSYHSNITNFCVSAIDSLGIGISDEVCVVPPTFVTSLNAPQITVASKLQGYSVSVTNTSEIAKSEFSNLEVWEIESESATAPSITYAGDGVTPTNYSRVYASAIIPANIVSPNLNKRWVIARFGSNAGLFSAFSSAVAVTPDNPIPVDITPPNEATSVSAVWSGDSIVVSYTPAVTDPGVRYQVQLTAPNTSVGYYYVFPSGSGAQTATISKADLFSQFGAYYSSFSGILRSIDSSDNRSSGVAFSVPTRTCSLTGVDPTFSVVGITNGYTVTFTLPASAAYADIYEKDTTWGMTNPTDETYRVYSGGSPAIIQDTDYTTKYIKIRFYDSFGCTSNYSAEQTVVAIDPITVDTEGPADVTTSGMSHSSGIDSAGVLGFNGYITLSWTAVTDTSLRGYRFRFTSDTGGSPVYQYHDYPITAASPPSGTLTYTLKGLEIGASYKVAIATYDELNNASLNYVSFNSGTAIAISGVPPITSYITAGNFEFGQGVDPTNTTGITGTKRGIFLDASNYWFLNSSNSARIKVGGVSNNYLLWDGSKVTIDGDLVARGGSFSGNVAMTTSGASIYNGDVTTNPGTLTGNGFILNNIGLFARSGTSTAQLTTTGGLVANFGQIADWSISSAKIESTLVSGITKYTGLSASNTKYAFWAGATTSSNSDDSAPFSVSPYGALVAKNVTITPSVASYTGVTATGTGSVMTYTTSAAHNLAVGQSVTIKSMSISGYNVTGTIASVPTTTSFTISGSATGSGTGGVVSVNLIAASNFFVDSTGTMTASGANVSGSLNVTGSSVFNGPIQITSPGYIFAPGAGGTATTGKRVIFSADGIGAYGDTGSTLLLTAPLADGSVFFTNSANIGGWKVNSSEFSKVATGGGQIILSSAAGNYGAVYVASSNGAKTSGIISSDTGSNGEVAIWAGGLASNNLANINTSKSSLGFYVTIDGDLFTTNATITGSELKSGKTSASDYLNAGFFFNKNGEFMIGGGGAGGNANNATYISLSQGNLILGLGAAGGQGALYVKGITQDNSDFSKNDPTLVAVVNDNTGTAGPYRVTRGRRTYWGFGYTPTEATALGNGAVADITYAQAGDIFFSTAT